MVVSETVAGWIIRRTDVKMILAAMLVASVSVPAMAEDKQCVAGAEFQAPGRPLVSFVQSRVGFDRKEVTLIIKRDGWSIKDGDKVGEAVILRTATGTFTYRDAEGIDDGAMVVWLSEDDFASISGSSVLGVSIGGYTMEPIDLLSFRFGEFNQCRVPWFAARQADAKAARMGQPVVDPFAK